MMLRPWKALLLLKRFPPVVTPILTQDCTQRCILSSSKPSVGVCSICNANDKLKKKKGKLRSYWIFSTVVGLVILILEIRIQALARLGLRFVHGVMLLHNLINESSYFILFGQNKTK